MPLVIPDSHPLLVPTRDHGRNATRANGPQKTARAPSRSLFRLDGAVRFRRLSWKP